jgi:vacuolar-type H+-ATPase subunit F/Vma7
MKKILVTTPHDAAGGFALAGVVQREAAARLPAIVDAAVADSAVGVIAIDERLLDAAAQEHLREIERACDGVIVVLPTPGTPARPEDDYARRLIRRAIGYQVKVQL